MNIIHNLSIRFYINSDQYDVLKYTLDRNLSTTIRLNLGLSLLQHLDRASISLHNHHEVKDF